METIQEQIKQKIEHNKQRLYKNYMLGFDNQIKVLERVTRHEQYMREKYRQTMIRAHLTIKEKTIKNKKKMLTGIQQKRAMYWRDGNMNKFVEYDHLVRELQDEIDTLIDNADN